MLKHKKEVIPLYSGASKSSVHVLICDAKDWNKGIDLINSFNDTYDPCFKYNDVAAFYTTTQKNGVDHFWIQFKALPTSLDTISHEIVHLVNAVCKSRGIKLDPDNDEAQAYLTGWVTSVVTKLFKKYIKL